MKFFKILIMLIFAIFTFLIGIYNQNKEVDLSIINLHIVCPIWLIVGVFFLLGLIANQVVSIIDDISYTNKIKEYKKQVKELKNEVLSLRKLTLKQDD
ncbi:MAG: hypothetical protein ACPLXO_00890 [Desulfurella sp.]|uniref:hypothetical protein n=1 Tax=Desulfurella sp. TaxID=1962857 RepID=UPI003C8AC7F6